ncbi:MAG: sulfur carrier protein ThiS [Bdellovibrionales bacterium]|nr:sulfur carrier protein ThiS [Bdellovibrionales bacterium]
MSEIVLNGEARSIAAGTVSELLEECKLGGKRVAVELNREIVPRDRYGATAIHSGDSIEIVHFVGGG